MSFKSLSPKIDVNEVRSVSKLSQEALAKKNSVTVS